MVDMRMRQENGLDSELLATHEPQEIFDFIARIDQNGLASVLTPDNEPILEKRRYGGGVEDHQSRITKTAMVLVVVDDLMFRSKISSAAKGVGASIAAATSADAAIERAREVKPRLIILDL